MPKNKDLTEESADEDLSAFHGFVKKIQPLKSDKILLRKAKVSPIKPPREKIKHDIMLPYVSDEGVVEPVTSDERVVFAKVGVNVKTIRQLKHGKYPIDKELDLHGCSSTHAKEKLLTFLLKALHENKRCVRVIHGKGSHSGNPLLKNKINNWLRQLDFVLAFYSTVPAHGGPGAVYILLKR